MRKHFINDGRYDKRNLNYVLLVEADRRGWVPARKTEPIIARKLEKNIVFRSREGILRGKKGEFFCLGPGGSYYVQRTQSLHKNYVRKGRYSKRMNIDYLRDGRNVQVYSDFIIFAPKPDAKKLVCRMRRAFRVQTPFGVLHGKRGDYLAKQYASRFDANPRELSVVAKTTFQKTFKMLKA